jgi:hypothetical protein
MARLDWNRIQRNEQRREAAKDLREMERLQRQANLATVPLLSTDEIKRRLSAIKATDQLARIEGRAISMRSIAIKSQISLGFLYLVINGLRSPGPNSQRKLSAVLQNVKI